MQARQIIILIIAFFIILLALAIAAFMAGSREALMKTPSKTTYRLVKVMEVETDTLSKQIPINGKLIAAEKVEVFSEVTGVLLKGAKPFKIGQQFDQGEVLLAIDGAESLLNLKSQRSSFLNLISQTLPDIKIDYPDSYDPWKNYLDAINPDDALPNLPEVKDAKLKNLLSGKNIYQQYYSVKSLENRQSKYTITAPFSGSVSMGNVNPGTVIRANQQVGEFIRDGGFELEAAVPTEDAGSVVPGSIITLDNGITGNVTRVAKNADPNTQRVSIYASVSAPGLKEGIYMEGVLHVTEIPDAIALSQGLITGDESVFLVQDSNLVKKPIEVVHRFEDKVIVTGLQPGELLLNQVIEGAYEGMLVKTESK